MSEGQSKGLINYWRDSPIAKWAENTELRLCADQLQAAKDGMVADMRQEFICKLLLSPRGTKTCVELGLPQCSQCEIYTRVLAILDKWLGGSK